MEIDRPASGVGPKIGKLTLKTTDMEVYTIYLMEHFFIRLNLGYLRHRKQNGRGCDQRAH
jgi:hypothetical protein